MTNDRRTPYTAAVFTLTDVHKSYGPQTVLDGVDLHVTRGETTVLIGPSGCGKSTILGLMTGLVTPDRGTVAFDNTPVTAATLPDVRRRIGYVIQDGGLFPHLSGRGNVTLMARHLGWTAERVNARVADLAALTHLPADILDRVPAEMSGGQRQRVALMRAMMLDPDVLLLDEPLGALDPMVRAALQRDLAALFARLGKTIVLVTHDIGEAAYFGDTVVLLKEGRVVQRGTPADLLERPSDPFVEQFVGAQREAADLIRRPAAGSIA